MAGNLRALVTKLARQELDWQGRSLLAPVVAPGRATVRLQGLVYQFSIRPVDFRGFGVFRLADQGFADWTREATPKEREQYLSLWPRVRLRLLKELESGSWLAHPVSRPRERGGLPLVVHEVARGSQFELVEAACAGGLCWFCGPVLNTRLGLAQEMSAALGQQVAAAELCLSGLTPQDRAAYAFLCSPVSRVGVSVVSDGDGRRLEMALAKGGGVLHSYSVEGDDFQVSWADSQGQKQFSRVRRRDMTVVSSGICLSDRDADFDLTSLVGVVEEDR